MQISEDEKHVNFIDTNKKLVLKGPTGCGKSTLLMNRYRNLIEAHKINSDSILVLVSNSLEEKLWSENISLKASGRTIINTYHSFVKEEFNLFYPLVLKNCTDIGIKRVKPLFLNYDAAKYLITKVVAWNRENNGLFPSIASQSDRIAADLLGNHFKAAEEGVPFKEICLRLSNSLPEKDEEKLGVFHVSENILDAYRKKCISLGVFDYALTLEFYRKYLLTDKNYLEQLKKRFKHLIVDSIEAASSEEVEFINTLISSTNTCLLGYNHEKGRDNGWGGAHLYLELMLFSNFKIIELDGSYTCSKQMYDYSEKLFNNINQKNKLGHKCSEVELAPVNELRSEMLKAIGEKIYDLINNEGYKPPQIAVISTYADPVTEIAIANVINKQGINLVNLKRKHKLLDNSMILGMYAMAQLCHPSYKLIPGIDSLRVMVKELFMLDPVRAYILAGEINALNTLPSIEWLKISKNWAKLEGKLDEDKYNYITGWIEFYRNLDKPLPINKFFYKLLLEVFLKDDISSEELNYAFNLLNDAEKFENVISRFESIKSGKGFLETMAFGINIHETEKSEINEYKDSVIIATPKEYLSGPYNHDIIILAGISSKNWVPRNIKELSNPIILNKAWKKDLVYTEEMEEENQIMAASYTLRAIIKKCKGRLIVFQSLLSSNGYENDGILADYLK